MRKLEEFVFEKLKVTNKSRSIHTTLRKFLAWYDETDEFSISKFNIEIRDFISSDESMSKRKITDFLYKHIDDKIDESNPYYTFNKINDYYIEIKKI